MSVGYEQFRDYKNDMRYYYDIFIFNIASIVGHL